jgi:RNA polymerase sigma factor (sigma-70 family)
MGTNRSQTAFVERIDRHRGILFTIAGVYCRRKDDREDLIAETIAQLWRAYGRFDGRVAFSTWMYRIAMNVAISFHRRETRRQRDTVHAEQTVIESIAAREEPQDERLALLHDLIERLDSLDRALMLLYLGDYSHAEIAATLGISASNVATKIGRIKERFKRSLAVKNL